MADPTPDLVAAHRPRPSSPSTHSPDVPASSSCPVVARPWQVAPLGTSSSARPPSRSSPPVGRPACCRGWARAAGHTCTTHTPQLDRTQAIMLFCGSGAGSAKGSIGWWKDVIGVHARGGRVSCVGGEGRSGTVGMRGVGLLLRQGGRRRGEGRGLRRALSGDTDRRGIDVKGGPCINV